MSYTPHILIKKEEFINALKKAYKEFYENEIGWYNIDYDFEDDLSNILRKNGLQLENLLNYYSETDKNEVYLIENKEYYWFYTEFSSESSYIINFLKKYKITYIVNH